MTICDNIELANTQQKLLGLEERYDQLRHDPSEDAHVRDRSLFSLKQVINQLKEEIARYETHSPARH